MIDNFCINYDIARSFGLSVPESGATVPYSTSELASMFNISPQVVKSWIKNGRVSLPANLERRWHSTRAGLSPVGKKHKSPVITTVGSSASLISRAMKAGQHKIIVAGNANDVLAKVRDHTPELLLLHTQWPQSWKLLSDLVSSRMKIPILILSNSAFNFEQIELASRAGAIGCLYEPFEINYLRREIMKALLYVRSRPLIEHH